MFTVCPKCALTLVVTPTDLRVAQGYVRCGRCSNVFNAIVGLSEERKDGGGSTPTSTASTSIIRKAPAIAEDLLHDSLSDTGETEAIYAEPDMDPDATRFQGVPVEKPKPALPPPSRSSTPPPSGRGNAQKPQTAAPPPPAPAPPTAPQPALTSRSAAPPSTPARPSAPPSVAAKMPPSPSVTPVQNVPPPPQKYDDNTDVPDEALEFDPLATDVTKIFVESPPPKKIDMRTGFTGTFEALKTSVPPPLDPPKTSVLPPPPPAAPPTSPKPAQTPRAATPAASPARPVAAPPPPRPQPPAAAASDATQVRTPSREGPRYPNDLVLEYDVRPVTVRFEAAKPPPAKLEAPTRESADSPLDVARSALKRDTSHMPERGIYADDRTAARSGIPLANEEQVINELPADDLAAAAMTAALMPAPAPRGRRAAWISGIVGLGVVLVAQAIHHNRHDLATNARLNRPLTKFYAAIGVPLVPRWNPASYDVRQLGAFSGGNGNLTVRASLKNNAAQPLPLPLLRITVQDRYGNRIATRDVEPKGYVPGTVPESAQLGVGQRLDAEMTFRDPGRDAVGFEIDACLPAPDGRIACSNDVTAAR